MSHKQSFFTTLFINDKPLLILVILFCLAQGILTIKRQQIFPILHYGMYSAPINKNAQINSTAVYSQNSPVSLNKIPRGKRLRTEGIQKILYQTTQSKSTIPQHSLPQYLPSYIQTFLQSQLQKNFQQEKAIEYLRSQLRLKSPWFLIQNNVKYLDGKPFIVQADTLLNG